MRKEKDDEHGFIIVGDWGTADQFGDLAIDLCGGGVFDISDNRDVAATRADQDDFDGSDCADFVVGVGATLGIDMMKDPLVGLEGVMFEVSKLEQKVLNREILIREVQEKLKGQETFESQWMLEYIAKRQEVFKEVEK